MNDEHEMINESETQGEWAASEKHPGYITKTIRDDKAIVHLHMPAAHFKAEHNNAFRKAYASVVADTFNESIRAGHQRKRSDVIESQTN